MPRPGFAGPKLSRLPEPLAVYIPHLDRRDLLLAALESLERQTRRAQVVVIDNGSSDGSVDLVGQRFPDVDVVELGSNRGFGPALNEGVRRHPAERLIFLNNDVVCEPGFIEALDDAAAAGAAMIAGVLLDHEDPGRIDSAGILADRTLFSFDYLHGEPVERAERARPPLGPTGGVALVRRDAFHAVGGFDERIFAYYEDLDLAIRLRLAGGECGIAPRARATHRHSATLGARTPAKYRLTGWSRAFLLRKYGVFGDPLRAGRALTGEALICGGQLLLDRTPAGLSGRIDGWRAAARVERVTLPASLPLMDVSLREGLRRRLRRRG